MSELSVDVGVANRFISSLSKSLQALCHGCMDFDSGIEIVGYININIDSGSKVDYVLNEKVLKSTNNSMTFVSNSFLAKKEQPKQTRNGSCSPIPELQPQPPSISRQQGSYQHSGFHHRSAFSHSSHSHVLGGSQKRAWGGTDRVSPKKYSRNARASFQQSSSQMQSPQTFGATTSDPSFLKPVVPLTSAESDFRNSDANIKKELSENESETIENANGNLLESNMNIKSDPDALPETGDTAAAPSTNLDLKDTFPQDPSDEAQNQEAVETPHIASHSESEFSTFDTSLPESSAADAGQIMSDGNMGIDQIKESQAYKNQETSEYEEATEDMSYSHSSYADQGETSGDGSQFDVIEIGDEDEDVQAMFGDPLSTTKRNKRKKKTPRKVELETQNSTEFTDEEWAEKDDSKEDFALNRFRHNEPLNQQAVDIMTKWFFEHVDKPYPSKADKRAMAKAGGITENQVKSWFANKRNRTHNTKPKVQMRAIEEKLVEVCEGLKNNNEKADNSHIIEKLSGIISNYQAAN